MTESQRPPIPPSCTPAFPCRHRRDRLLPMMRRRAVRSGSLCKHWCSGSPRAAVNSAPPPPPPASYSGHRSSAVSPMPSSVHFAPTLEQLVREANDKGFPTFTLGIGEVPRFREQGRIITTDYLKTDEETFFGWLRRFSATSKLSNLKRIWNTTVRRSTKGWSACGLTSLSLNGPDGATADSVEILNGTAEFTASVSGAVSLP